VSTIYVVERVYSSFEIQLKAYRIEAEAHGAEEAYQRLFPDQKFRVRQMELVED
jgi:hypothetical protein